MPETPACCNVDIHHAVDVLVHIRELTDVMIGSGYFMHGELMSRACLLQLLPWGQVARLAQEDRAGQQLRPGQQAQAFRTTLTQCSSRQRSAISPGGGGQRTTRSNARYASQRTGRFAQPLTCRCDISQDKFLLLSRSNAQPVPTPSFSMGWQRVCSAQMGCPPKHQHPNRPSRGLARLLQPSRPESNERSWWRKSAGASSGNTFRIDSGPILSRSKGDRTGA